ncbi:unnamed protein product [Acanthoscelides obtectus]|uniref:PBZ-type domain-containing protein n=1 Tax=Acanthoscelides obtectus TaxID=200917 RepID=A0A9P0KFM9_ACAOB|nr:unnamed protein product [Acanthoscelides obtectus]CAK1667507.1 Aprataxin and PNK-like factor [Acanthoscelides obtectus]
MTVVKIFNIDDIGLKQPLKTFPKGDHVIGRGELNCHDKRISRKHAIISITDNAAELKAIHINPCFYKADKAKSIEILEQNTTKELSDGDTFSLLADNFWFRVKLISRDDSSNDVERNSLPKRTCDELDTSPNKRIRTDEQNASPNTPQIRPVDTQKLLKNIQQIDSEDYPDTLCQQNDDSNQSVDLLDLMQTAENEPIDASRMPAAEVETQDNNEKQTTTAGKDTAVKERVSDSEDETSNVENTSQSIETTLTAETHNAVTLEPKPEPLDDEPMEKASSSLTVKIEPAEDASATIKKEATMESNENDPRGTDSSNAAGSSATSDKPKILRRDRCWYGTSCYRKNPIHRQDFSHPGDTDYDSDPEDDRPPCPFGNACYRTNMLHRRQYKHPGRPAPKPSKVQYNLNIAGCPYCSHCTGHSNREDRYDSEHDFDSDSGLEF